MNYLSVRCEALFLIWIYERTNSSIYVFFFKQKTAYELRISDWSSDVCSSDLGLAGASILVLGFPALAVWQIGLILVFGMTMLNLLSVRAFGESEFRSE